MSRWDPDARSRLERAAYELYLERGFDNVTVADITERVGLKPRSFFRHFPDKREVLFSGSDAFQAKVLAAITEAEPSIGPMDVVAGALAAAGAYLAEYGEPARLRAGIVAASTDLQERELIKMAALSAAITHGLRERGVDDLTATLTAQAGNAVFTTAFQRWVDDRTADFTALFHRTLDDFRQAVQPG